MRQEDLDLKAWAFIRWWRSKGDFIEAAWRLQGWRDGASGRDNRMINEDYKRGYQDGLDATAIALEREAMRLREASCG